MAALEPAKVLSGRKHQLQLVLLRTPTDIRRRLGEHTLMVRGRHTDLVKGWMIGTFVTSFYL